jgi:hypothetical protein
MTVEWEPAIGDKVQLKAEYKNDPAYSISPTFRMMPYFEVLAVQDEGEDRKVVMAKLCMPGMPSMFRWIDIKYFEPFEE